MQRLYKIITSLIGVVLLPTSGNAAAPGESIVLNPTTGDYTITYCGLGPQGAKDTCMLRQVIFVPATKINPRIMSAFLLDKDWTIGYRYKVKNGPSSKQPLSHFALDPVSDILSSVNLRKEAADLDTKQVPIYINAGRAALRTPTAWEGNAFYNYVTKGIRIVWSFKNRDSDNDGLQSGDVQNGFGFMSKDLPGVIAAQCVGNSGLGPSFEDEGPDGESAQFTDLQTHDFVVRFAAAPKITVPSPFSAAELLTRIKSHTQTWIGMELLDPVLYSRLDQAFQTAINTASRDDLNATRKVVKDIQQLLKKEHPDVDTDDDHDEGKGNDRVLIDKLAARILNFNLTYVLKRTGEN